MTSPGFARGRRLRSTPALRRLTAQTRLAPADFGRVRSTELVAAGEQVTRPSQRRVAARKKS